jgi:hypothetical protein
MDTSQVKEQILFIANEIERQSALAGKNFKLYINKRLIDYFGNRDIAFKRTKVALAILEEKLDILEVTNSRFTELEFDEEDRYDRAWFELKLKDAFFKTEDGLVEKDVSFNARTGTLHIKDKLIEFEPRTRKATILALSLQRPNIGVGFERISSGYERIDPTAFLTDKQIRDEVRQINKKITETLPEVTEFLTAKNGFVRANK